MITFRRLVRILQAATGYAFIGTKGNDTRHLAKLAIVFVTIPPLHETYFYMAPTIITQQKPVSFKCFF
jgi:hypothetical protein